ncbi:MAG: MucBP domain-containing protein [Erysipelotrichales bacterium]
MSILALSSIALVGVLIIKNNKTKSKKTFYITTALLISLTSLSGASVYAFEKELAPKVKLELERDSNFDYQPQKIRGYNYVGYLESYEKREIPSIDKGKVDIEYQDSEGNQLQDPKTISGEINAEYNVDIANIDGYYFKNAIGNLNGVFIKDPQKVILVYDKVDAKKGLVNVEFQDTKGNTLKEPQSYLGSLGDSFNIEAIKIDNYKLVKVVGKVSGIYELKPQKIIFIYDRNEVLKTKVTIKYVDANDHNIKLADDIILTGVQNDSFEVPYKEFGDYSFTERLGYQSNIFDDQNREVIMTYQKREEIKAKVVIKYIDENNNKLANDINLEGKKGTRFDVEQKIFDGYSFKERQGNQTNILDEYEQEVLMVYKKDKPVESKVTIKYLNKKNEKLHSDITLSGEVGTSFNVEQKSFDKYTFYERQGYQSNIFNINEQEIRMIYEEEAPVQNSKIIIKYVNEDNEKISEDSIIEGNAGLEFKVIPKDIDKYIYKERQGYQGNVYTPETQTIILVYKKEQYPLKIVYKFDYGDYDAVTFDFRNIKEANINVDTIFYKTTDPITKKIIRMEQKEPFKTYTINNWNNNIDILDDSIPIDLYFVDKNGEEKTEKQHSGTTGFKYTKDPNMGGFYINGFHKYRTELDRDSLYFDDNEQTYIIKYKVKSEFWSSGLIDP